MFFLLWKGGKIDDNCVFLIEKIAQDISPVSKQQRSNLLLSLILNCLFGLITKRHKEHVSRNDWTCRLHCTKKIEDPLLSSL